MEVLMTKSPLAVKEEKSVGFNADEEGGVVFAKFGRRSPTHGDDRSKSSSPSGKDSTLSKQLLNPYNGTGSERSSGDTTSASTNPRDLNAYNEEEQLEQTRAEMGEVREENERLKLVLSRILKDYQSLQTQLLGTIQNEQAKKPNVEPEAGQEEADLVSLSLGTTASSGNKKAAEKASSGGKSKDDDDGDNASARGGLSLGLDCRFDMDTTSTDIAAAAGRPEEVNMSTENSSEEQKEEEEEAAGNQWPPNSKVLKTVRSGDDDVSQQVQVKKASVSVRARCDTPTMNDGCQWRKYGQKISKGNPCPRAYYRCTVAPACPVRKQVQRCADDMSILITTYEGAHNHPLPMAATAMASTTSAAASMLVSGSSAASRPAFGATLAAINTTTPSALLTGTSLHGLNFSLSDSTRTRPYYLQSTTTTNPSSMSASPPYQTITLDLTSSTTAPPSSTSQYNRFSTGYTPSTAPRFPTTGFSFSPSESVAPQVPSWINGAGHLSYGSSQLFGSTKSQVGALDLVGRPHTTQAQEPFFNLISSPSYLQKAQTGAAANAASGGGPPLAPASTTLTDTIAKAITTDPSFQSALAAAITSIVGGGQQGKEAVSQTLRLGSSSAPTLQSSLSSFLNRSRASSQASPQQGSQLVKSTSAAPPVENREHIS